MIVFNDVASSGKIHPQGGRENEEDEDRAYDPPYPLRGRARCTFAQSQIMVVRCWTESFDGPWGLNGSLMENDVEFDGRGMKVQTGTNNLLLLFVPLWFLHIVGLVESSRA